jgi:hypothetical protein
MGALTGPSLDRIHPKDGYRIENVRVILKVLNVMMNNWGEEKVLEIAAALKAKVMEREQSLQGRLERALKTKINLHGSPLFDLTWKKLVTPSGQRYCQLAASARRTSAIGCSGWPTPRVSSANDTANSHERAGNGKARLEESVHLAAWPTPKVEADRTGWKAMDRQDSMSAMALGQVADMAAGIIPREMKRCRPETVARHGLDKPWTGPARLTAFGMLLTGSTAGTASGGKSRQLSPEFSLWLMGLPSSWARAAPTKAKAAAEWFEEPETPSCCRWRGRSSRRRSRRSNAGCHAKGQDMTDAQ